MKRPLPALICGLLLGSTVGLHADTAPAALPPLPPVSTEPELRFSDMFRPFGTDRATLSPDGRYLAYSLREGEQVSVAIVEIDHPEVLKAKVVVATDETSTPMLDITTTEKTPARIRWMGWVTPTRLAIETNRVYSASQGESWQSVQGLVLAVDADGKNGREMLKPSDVADRIGNADKLSGTESLGPAAIDRSRRHDPVFSADKANMGLDTWRGEPADLSNTSVTTMPSDTPANAGLGEATGSDDPAATVDLSIGGMLRSFTVFDYSADDPESVLIRTTGGESFGIYKLNVVTGKLKHLAEEAGDPGYAPLLDRRGHPRAGVANSTLAAFPHPYVVEKNSGLDRWKKLDGIIGREPGQPGFWVSPENYFRERAVPVGFDENPQTLYFASNVGRDRYGLFSLDLKTGKPGDLALTVPDYDLYVPDASGFAQGDTLVFDRYYRRLVGVRYEGRNRTARWLRPEWQALQDELERTLRGRSVELLEWDQAGNRFLLLSRSPTDAGAFYVYDRSTRKLSEFVQRKPWLRPDTVPARIGFAFTKPSGEKVTGVLTAPRNQRTKLIPMVVYCPSVPWERLHSDYQSEINALADMGFAVVQLNTVGAWGFGVKHREAIKAGYEQAQLADIVFAVDELAKQFQVNGRRVALMGEGHGGFLALRGLQLHPDRFRCAVAIDAIIDPETWLAKSQWITGDPTSQLTRAYFGDDASLKAAPLVRQPETIKQPICLLTFGGIPGQARNPLYLQARALAGAVERHKGTAEVVELETDYARGLPKARSKAFRKVEEFLNAHVYNYEVTTGAPKKLDD